MDNVAYSQSGTLAKKLKFLDQIVANLHGNTWLASLTEDLRSEAILACLEGRDPKAAVNEYLEHEAENCPASCSRH